MEQGQPVGLPLVLFDHAYNRLLNEVSLQIIVEHGHRECNVTM